MQAQRQKSERQGLEASPPFLSTSIKRFYSRGQAFKRSVVQSVPKRTFTKEVKGLPWKCESSCILSQTHPVLQGLFLCFVHGAWCLHPSHFWTHLETAEDSLPSSQANLTKDVAALMLCREVLHSHKHALKTSLCAAQLNSTLHIWGLQTVEPDEGNTDPVLIMWSLLELSSTTSHSLSSTHEHIWHWRLWVSFRVSSLEFNGYSILLKSSKTKDWHSDNKPEPSQARKHLSVSPLVHNWRIKEVQQTRKNKQTWKNEAQRSCA